MREKGLLISRSHGRRTIMDVRTKITIREDEIFFVAPSSVKVPKLHMTTKLQNPKTEIIRGSGVEAEAEVEEADIDSTSLPSQSTPSQNLFVLPKWEELEEVLTQPNQNLQNTYPEVGARLQKFWHVWQQKGADPWIVSTLKEGYSIQFQSKPKLSNRPIFNLNSRNPQVSLEIEEMIKKGRWSW